MKWRNKVTGVIANTDRRMEYPWEPVEQYDEPLRGSDGRFLPKDEEE